MKKIDSYFIDSVGFNESEKIIYVKLSSSVDDNDIETIPNSSYEDYKSFINSKDLYGHFRKEFLPKIKDEAKNRRSNVI